MPHVTIYSTPTCAFCHKAKAYFREKGIRFTDIDVSEDEFAKSAMINKSGQMAVPVIEIGDRIIVGFDQTKIDAALYGV